MKMKNLLNISNKGVILSSFLLASFLIGLVVFFGSALPVQANSGTTTIPIDLQCNNLCIDAGYTSGGYCRSGDCLDGEVFIGKVGCPACQNCCCYPECCDDADCDDSNPCTDDACVDGLCEYTNNQYEEEEVCGYGDCTGKKTRTCSDGSFGPWSDCSTYGDVCDECDPGPDCVIDEITYTIDVWVNGAWYCDEEGICTDECVYDHFCLDDDYFDGFYTFGCGAECDGYGEECLDYCEGDTLYIGYCDLWPGDCTCYYDPYDCNNDDGWYDTGNTRWVETDQCNEKEQKEQEYRDYYCYENLDVYCDYDTTGTQWVDTENTRYKPESTPCDDGLFCSETDHCDGQGNCVELTERTCSDGDECTYDICNEELDQCENPHKDEDAPITDKWYEPEPYENDAEWITSETEVWLDAVDEGPQGLPQCAVGVNETYWRNSIVNNDYCWDELPCEEAVGSGDWNVYEEPFTKGQESCHLIEYYSIDNFDNQEEVKKQCVFVDNTGPEPVKTVGDPKTKWDGKDAYFYDIEGLCWNGQEDEIECWKVTLLTEIEMDCEDKPEEHPVGFKELCYKVDLDGDDVTSDYCSEYGGDMKEGWCCVDEEPYMFYFREETYHELEYYCIDELDNEGDIDIEKFKVEGTNFEIQLNKKWNLISMPFVLLSDDPEEIFAGIAENLDSVWTFDPEHYVCDDTDEEGWCVYTANGDPDTLNHIIPGWGYWIMMKDGDTLLIGGSLFQPKVTPPTRKLISGWNLIGYYGTEGAPEGPNEWLGYYGPDENGDYAYCALYSLVNTNSGLTKWSSLVTYWQPYLEPWKYLDECNNMDPGAGYWIEMDVEESYAPATVCPDHC